MHEKKVCSIPVQQIGGLGSVLFCLARSDALPSGRAKGGGEFFMKSCYESPCTMSRWNEWHITVSATRAQSGVRNIFIYVSNIFNTWPSKIWFLLDSYYYQWLNASLRPRHSEGKVAGCSIPFIKSSLEAGSFNFFSSTSDCLGYYPPIVIRIYHIILWEQSFVYFANIVPLRAPALWYIPFS